MNLKTRTGATFQAQKTRLGRWARRMLCKAGIHRKRTGAHVQIQKDGWHVTYEYRCRCCPANLGERTQIYP